MTGKEIFPSSTEIVLAAVGTLSTNVLVAVGSLLLIAFGFLFLFWFIRKGRNSVVKHTV